MAPKSAAAKSPKTTKKAKAAPKEKRAPSAYNTFMKTEVEKVKKANPNLKPAEAFKAAALNWKDSPQNPKKQ